MSTIQFPIVIESGAPVMLVEYTDTVKQAVLDRLGTDLNNVFFQRSYGSYLSNLIFEQNDEVLHSLINHFVTECLQNENRIRLGRVEIEKKDKITSVIVVNYTVIKTQIKDKAGFEFTVATNEGAGFSFGFSLGFNA